jgi:hypothetical protein
MKLHKSIFACVLFLLFGAALLGAAPAAVETAAPAVEPAAAAAPEAAAPAASFEALGPAACAVESLAASAGFDYVCGQCSQDPCKGAAVDSTCGFANGQWKRCQDYLGATCPADGGARCRCSSDPIP